MKKKYLYVFHFCSEILSNIAFDWTSILKIIKIKSNNNLRFNIHSKNMNFSLEAPVFPACKSLDIAPILKNENITPMEIAFEFYKIENIGLFLYIEDRNKDLKRPLKSAKLSYSGPSISNKNLNSPTRQSLILSVSQSIDSPYDKGKNCRIYPQNGFASYGECDKDFVSKEYHKKYKLIPFWLTENMEEVTKLR